MRRDVIETREEFRVLEKIPVEILDSYEEVSLRVAEKVSETIQENRDRGKKTVLGLDTGNAVVGIYREWVRLHKEEGMDFSGVVVYDMGDYYPLDPESLQSHRRYLQENLFDHVNIPPSQIHHLGGEIPRARLRKACAEFEDHIRSDGGIDVQILELGAHGQIGFNHPGTAPTSRPGRIILDEATRKEAAADFFSEENVPESAVTVGLGALLEAKEVYLVAIGEGRAPAVAQAVEGSPDNSVPASHFQGHAMTTLFTDREAAEELTRIKKPWLLDEVKWDERRTYRAVIELSTETGVPLSRLDPSDYAKNHLTSLLRESGPADVLNTWVSERLMSRIRNTPEVFEKKRVLIFSPHPDDDVICMGGTMQKLVEKGNRVDVAYMTSGSLAVFDEDALRHIEFIQRIRKTLGMTETGVTKMIKNLMRLLDSKKIGEVDAQEIQEVKRVIRESEAVAAIETLGIKRDRAHFLNLPFYRTGRVKKDPIGKADVDIVLEILRRVKPHFIFVAGDMTDPHGTHRMCKQAIDRALSELRGKKPEVWLYRGAWQEWDIHDVDVFVPLSKSEVKKKRLSIFKHESQKDRAVFPGPSDDREFWERAEDRNRGTAEALDRLGLQEFFAMEAFVVEG